MASLGGLWITIKLDGITLVNTNPKEHLCEELLGENAFNACAKVCTSEWYLSVSLDWWLPREAQLI